MPAEGIVEIRAVAFHMSIAKNRVGGFTMPEHDAAVGSIKRAQPLIAHHHKTAVAAVCCFFCSMFSAADSAGGDRCGDTFARVHGRTTRQTPDESLLVFVQYDTVCHAVGHDAAQRDSFSADVGAYGAGEFWSGGF